MNESWFFITMFADLFLVLFAWRMGKEWLVATIVMNLILVSTFGPKIISIFGFETSLANVFYASIFIATDILTEHHGKKEGYRSIWIGFLCLFGFVIFGQMVLQFEAIEQTTAVSGAMDTLFGAVLRISIASFIAYAIAQSFDIWFFHWLMEKTGRDRLLWLRNCGSTLTSQFIDSMIFFPLAFAGLVPLPILINIVITGYVLKSMIALFDTPFLYMSYFVKGQKPPDFGHRKKDEPKNLGI